MTRDDQAVPLPPDVPAGQCGQETTSDNQTHHGTHICRRQDPHAGVHLCAICGHQWELP